MIELPTEHELELLANSLIFGAKETAARFDITLSTVKNTLAHLRKKLEAQTSVQAAYLLGWLEFPPGINLAEMPSGKSLD